LRKQLIFLCVILILSAITLSPSFLAWQVAKDRIRLTLDTSEAEEVLYILKLRQDGKSVGDGAWQKLFGTEPYQRLKKREAQMGQSRHDSQLGFTDDDFKKFVLSDDALKRAADLQAILDQWKKVNLRASAERVLQYLPDQATIRAKVFPVIKPRPNSFVFETDTDPAIFLYLDPGESPAKFENTVAHELHHIGLGSLGPVYDKKIAGLPERAGQAAIWMGAFGEGLAMLAAAGGPDIDPHATSSAEERLRWQHDLANFESDLEAVNEFFVDALSGTLPNKEAVDQKAFSFFGVQGPWYTVGYRMAVIVEKRFGRRILIDTMLDPRQLLLLYNRAATELNAAHKESLPLWSGQMLKQCVGS
jgi:hypothetical protein